MPEALYGHGSMHNVVLIIECTGVDLFKKLLYMNLKELHSANVLFD